jgi:hypothetical protein
MNSVRHESQISEEGPILQRWTKSPISQMLEGQRKDLKLQTLIYASSTLFLPILVSYGFCNILAQATNLFFYGSRSQMSKIGP